MATRFRNEPLLPELWQLTRRAGEAILEIYQQEDVEVVHKADDSPVTAADLASEEILLEGLRRLTPTIPVLSEEHGAVPWKQRRSWKRSWVVDPLDGTREFLGRNGEFTVNVALVDRSDPILGLVLAPTLGLAWAGAYGPEERDAGMPGRAWRLDDQGAHRIHVHSEPAAVPRVVTSRSHSTPELDRLLDRLPSHERIAVGSSLKFCWVAEGRADFYARLSPTMEWDTAAGHAVLRAAGGEVVAADGRPFRYNRQRLLNEGFVAHGLRSEPWSKSWQMLADAQNPMPLSRAARGTQG